ncbi:hypothetical protein E3E31_06550 [Thermococcus sp. M39]|uniref:hypothetical protein n=1 Tax=unclassified Thermococcus TaxID=2627626 RepID=UPI00143C3E23|nr:MULTISPECIES: hypothetical protein [unclassified Thermococcus]NJE08182.1 hypothetical protein [Thermococcus sp. M39]NJE11675.1 hypothetical protein [Thermococcus sp. LS2]
MDMLHSNVERALGVYIDNLCSSLHIGTARGTMFLVHKDKRYPIISAKTALPLIDIFYKSHSLEFISFWRDNGKNMYGYAKFAVSRIKILGEKGDYLVLAVEPHGHMINANVYIIIILWTVPGFKKTLFTLLEEEKDWESEEEDGIIDSSYLRS